jgi:site-specific recombinase XerD
MDIYLDQYLAYLSVEKNCSANTLMDYRLELEKLYKYIITKTNSLNEVNITNIRSYILDIKEKRNLCNNSIYKKTAILKSFFNFLEGEEAIEKNPTKKIHFPRKEKQIPKVLTHQEFEWLIKCLRYSPARCRKNYIRDKLIFHMLYYCGLRRCELLNLDWDDINLESKMLFIRSTKNKSDRIMPIHDKVCKLLDQYLEERLPLTCKALIIGEIDRRLTINPFTVLINMHLAISGLKKKGYTAHSFRHSFATRLIEKKVNLLLIQRLLGHLSLDSLLYKIVSQELNIWNLSFDTYSAY